MVRKRRNLDKLVPPGPGGCQRNGGDVILQRHTGFLTGVNMWTCESRKDRT